MLWRELRHESLERLRAGSGGDAEQELRWIVEQACGRAAPEQMSTLDEPVTEREVGAVHRMVERRVSGEPLQYVLGRWGFRTLDLLVDARVLIPRPETEDVAGLAIDEVRRLERPAVVADLGTGSGAIALSVAAECWPDVEVWATDASADALAVASANLAGLGRRAAVVRLVEGDWFAALGPGLRGRVDVVISNPPYVPASAELPAAVRDWEPTDALVPGPSGLEAIERIVGEAPEWLGAGALLVVEIGEEQGPASQRLAAAAGLTQIEVHLDLAGRPRALTARRPRSS